MSGYQPQNRLYHYESYCKYSQLYEAVMGRTKDLIEVTRNLKSLILSLHAAGKHRKDMQAMWAAARPPSPVSSMLLLWKAEQQVGNRRPPHKMTDSFAGLPRPTGSRQSPNCPKSGVVLLMCLPARTMYCSFELKLPFLVWMNQTQ